MLYRMQRLECGCHRGQTPLNAPRETRAFHPAVSQAGARPGLSATGAWQILTSLGGAAVGDETSVCLIRTLHTIQIRTDRSELGQYPIGAKRYPGKG